MANVITVEELYKRCKAQIAQGNGKKKILLSSDDEGNEFHEMFFTFTPTDGYFEGKPYDPIAPREAVEKPDDYIILG